MKNHLNITPRVSKYSNIKVDKNGINNAQQQLREFSNEGPMRIKPYLGGQLVNKFKDNHSRRKTMMSPG